MKLHKISALAAVSVLAFAACSSGGASTAPSAPPAVAAAPRCRRALLPVPRSARTRRATARPRSTSTRASRSRARTPPQTTTIVDADQGDARRPEGRQLHHQVHQPRRLVGRQERRLGRRGRAARTPTRPPTIRTRWSTSAPTTRAPRSCRSRSSTAPAWSCSARRTAIPGLTKAVDGVTAPGEPDSYYPGGYRNYARDINTDDAQGAASSEWAYSQGKKKAYVIDDGQTYGQGIGRAWAQHFGKIGGKVVSPNGSLRELRPEGHRLLALAQKIKAPGRTSSSSVRSPARARPSSGRTSRPRTRTSRCSGRTASTRSPGMTAPALPATALPRPSVASTSAS